MTTYAKQEGKTSGRLYRASLKGRTSPQYVVDLSLQSSDGFGRSDDALVAMIAKALDAMGAMLRKPDDYEVGNFMDDLLLLKKSVVTSVLFCSVLLCLLLREGSLP